jgi:hypothetical protein
MWKAFFNGCLNTITPKCGNVLPPKIVADSDVTSIPDKRALCGSGGGAVSIEDAWRK